ncbi:MAG: hypothetical protein WCO11_08890 [Sphingomonadales bacterium]|jgi:hypothetical protein
MMMILAFAVQSMVTLAPPARNDVPATAFVCELTLADGAAFKLSGIAPAFRPGRDPNAEQVMTLTVENMAELVGRGFAKVESNSGSEFRDYQIVMPRGEAMYIANLKLRAASGGVVWVTRYAPTKPPEAYRYFAVGHCRSDFEGKPVS